MNDQSGCCSNLTDFLSADLFKALGDDNRLAIIAALAECGDSQRVSDIAGCCPVDLSVVSRHLKILAQAGLLEVEKQGKEVRYRIRTGHIAGLLRGMADALESCCPDGIFTLTGKEGGAQ